jgi:hypothetical protein
MVEVIPIQAVLNVQLEDQGITVRLEMGMLTLQSMQSRVMADAILQYLVRPAMMPMPDPNALVQQVNRFF